MSYPTVARVCEHCRVEFIARKVDVAKGKARFCSKSCAQLKRGTERRAINEALRGPRRNKADQKARNALNYQIERGRIQRQPCEVCGEPKSQAHHHDYSKPFDVRWLCQKHHAEAHSAEATWAGQVEARRLASNLAVDERNRTAQRRGFGAVTAVGRSDFAAPVISQP